MFIWSVPVVVGELRAHCPEIAGFIDAVATSDDIPGTIAESFPSLPKASIDYALMEKATRFGIWRPPLIGTTSAGGSRRPHTCRNTPAGTGATGR